MAVYTTIDDAGIFFNLVLYTGTGTTHTITGVGFQPDFVWAKARSQAQSGRIIDAVRGGDKVMYPDLTNAEGTDAELITSFNSDGYIMGTSGTNANDNTETYVSWNWKANGQGSSNTDGTINTIYTSASTTSGFSMSTYTGTGSAGTIGHGLGVAPTAIWIKKTSGTQDWFCWNKGLTAAGGFLKLNETDAASTNASAFPWNPLATTFGLSTDAATNASGGTYIAYCFAPVQGYSAFGSYLGNGNIDGPFVYTGFRPAMIIRKLAVGGSDSWMQVDRKRLGYNPNNAYLFPNATQAESDLTRIDLCANGFKLRTTDGGDNGSGNTYIYMAWAESPLVNSEGVPTNAR